jgi:hypothetical protein
MYFNHAFKKSLLAGPNAVTKGVLTLPTAGTLTSALTAGRIGIFNAKTYASITAAPATNTPFILAQGSYFSNDKIGVFHGGYQESIKSKVINPKYITRVFTTCAQTPQNNVVALGWNLDDGDPGFAFECGKTYRLRIDLKGSPALRFLSHNVYNTVDVFSGCCTDDCTATCTGAPVDAACVLLGWKDRITINPILSQFIVPSVVYNDGGDIVEIFSADDVAAGRDLLPKVAQADSKETGVYECNTVAPETVIASLILTVAYEDTKFGSCTFRVTDHYELMPLKILVSITDESGEPCAIKNTANSSSEYVATGQSNLVIELQEGLQAQGVGETVIRDVILAGRYRQEAFPDGNFTDSLRMRKIEVPDEIRDFDTASLYNSVNILHSVPRFNNPSGTFDNDQYLITIWLEDGINAFSFVDLLQDILDGAGNGVVVEHLTTTGLPCPNFVTP